MRVLVACEESGVVRDAFAALGHDAWSCDLLPRPGNHICDDVLLHLEDGWDLMIAHPPCQYLSVSGLHWNKRRPERAEKTKEAMIFVFNLAGEGFVDNPIKRICIENPVSCISTHWRKPDQIIQPWQFGHPESKATCLWLKNLPLLKPTDILPLPKSGRWKNQTPSGQNKLGPSPDRAMLRAKTYLKIARAMAIQWGGLSPEPEKVYREQCFSFQK